MNLSSIQSIDDLVKRASASARGTWSDFYDNIKFVRSESEGECTIISGSDVIVDDYGTTQYSPDQITEFYFKIVLKTSITLKQLVVLLEVFEIIDAVFAHDAMKNDSKKIIPTVFSFLKHTLKDSDLDYDIFNYAGELIYNPYDVAYSDLEFVQHMMSETNSTLVIVPEITVEDEIINIKLTGTSYDPDVPDEIKIKF